MIVPIILSFNMAEAALRLRNAFDKHNRTYVIVDNGSNPPLSIADIRLETNVRTTHGWMMGKHYADALAAVYGHEIDAYWFISTSSELVGDMDHVGMMEEALADHPDAVMIQPAWVGDLTAWTHKLNEQQYEDGLHEAKLAGPACVIRKSWFDEIGGFNPRLTHSWGLDFELSKLAEKRMLRHDGVQMRIVENIAYQMGRMNMTSQERKTGAREEMISVLSEDYGPEWAKVLDCQLSA